MHAPTEDHGRPVRPVMTSCATVDTGGVRLNALEQRRPGAALGCGSMARSWGPAIILHARFLHSGISGRLRAQGCDGLDTLLNGLTAGVSPMPLSQHPTDHAQKRARSTNGLCGLGVRKLSARS